MLALAQICLQINHLNNFSKGKRSRLGIYEQAFPFPWLASAAEKLRGNCVRHGNFLAILQQLPKMNFGMGMGSQSPLSTF